MARRMLITGGNGGGGLLRMASQFNRTYSGTITGGSNGTGFVADSHHQIGSGIFTKLKLLFNNNWYNPGVTTGPVGPGNSVTVDRAYIRIQGQAAHQLFFSNGNFGITMADGAIDVLGDDILPALIGQSDFHPGMASGADIVVTIYGVIPSGMVLPLTQGTEALVPEGYTYDPTATTPVFPPSSTGPTFTGTAPTNAVPNFAPMLVGTFASGDPYTWFGAGDSIFVNGNRASYFGRMLRTKAAAGVFVGRLGGVVTQLGNNGCSLVKYCSGAVEEYGTNSVAFLTAAQYLTQSRTGWGQIRAGSVVSPAATPFILARTGLLCWTGSTDGWITLGNQTTHSAVWDSGGVVEQLNNTTFPGQVGISGGCDLFTNVSNSIRGSITVGDPNYYLWNAPPAQTADGEHPNPTAAITLGDALAALLPT